MARWGWAGGAAALAALGAGVAAMRPAPDAMPPPGSSVQIVPARPHPRAVTPAPTRIEPYRVRHIMPIDHPMRFGEWYWDEAGAPGTGRIVVTVDLRAQVLSVFRDGWEIGTAVILYGAGRTPTPLGIFRISQKDADHHSTIYNHAPMPFMMRLTNDGVSIHGDLVADGWATHGCVGVPTPFAKELFGVVKLGDTVIVTSGERLGPGGAIGAA